MIAVPRLIFELPLAEDGASDGEGLALAVTPSGELVVQVCLAEPRLRSYTEQLPPTFAVQAEAAVEMAREILRQLRPDLAATIERDRRAALRLVGGGDDGPEEAA